MQNSLDYQERNELVSPISKPQKKKKKKKNQINSSIEPKATLSILFIANELAPT